VLSDYHTSGWPRGSATGVREVLATGHGKAVVPPSSFLHGRESDPEAARDTRRHDGVAAVQARDLAHQRETETGAGRIVAEPVKRRKHALALALGHPLSAVRHVKHRECAGAADRHAPWRRASA